MSTFVFEAGDDGEMTYCDSFPSDAIPRHRGGAVRIEIDMGTGHNVAGKSIGDALESFRLLQLGQRNVEREQHRFRKPE